MPEHRPPRVFVYGNLMPGWPKWQRLRPFARTIRVDSVPGRLYETGEGRPAAVFDGAANVEGWIVELHTERVDRAFQTIAKSLGSGYREVVVTTRDGVEAVAFEWEGPTDGFRELAGRWRDPERRTG